MIKNIFKKIYRSIIELLPPKLSIVIQFLRRLHRLPNLANPRSFNEKIQKLKLTPPTDDMVRFSSKSLVKPIIAEILGADWVIPSYWQGQYLPPREERLWPVPFVIKASHASGWNRFVITSKDCDWDLIERDCKLWDRPFEPFLYETWYNLSPREIVVEPYLGEIASLPLDFKFFVFNGNVEWIQVDTDRATSHKRVFFDRKWNRAPFNIEYPIETREIAQPIYLEEMISAAETIGKRFKFVRVDLYELENGPKFGEATFAPGSGYERFSPPAFDLQFGQLWR
ncbi:ATP-grasp fold amidoligase family protein [Caulobacter henricii]|uniref:ATP-grasp fold amidoligase family protein n=1 Tax=Caulobacter henricii TaxID=69395 RepID=UPI0009FC44ED|nr:ATP-grasp fold amidoligase family protein [Caulobacter henricii]